MRNWFEVGVRETQNGATQLQKRGNVPPKLLSIKSLTITCGSLSVTQIQKETAREGKARETL